jgi:cleavage stimulation factor subunit 3
VWLQYATFEHKKGSRESLEAVFSRSLKQVLHLDLWKFYLKYVKELNSVCVEGGQSTCFDPQGVVIKAYEFALGFIGVDFYSGAIWMEYLDFVRSCKCDSLFQEQQRMDLQRKVYQRAACIPMSNLEEIWKDYDNFENSLNRITVE